MHPAMQGTNKPDTPKRAFVGHPPSSAYLIGRLTLPQPTTTHQTPRHDKAGDRKPARRTEGSDSTGSRGDDQSPPNWKDSHRHTTRQTDRQAGNPGSQAGKAHNLTGCLPLCLP
ncbi:hypothetical protein VE01_10727 [Pseudogymnoascus verrucosus]|uniref:Uncharacterized protein n=1 Tax=Pseudogymnoascus verrucosus TaxID=342668 RepID=A0A2P6FGR3_9PEZI|nr:uncharacterized protein VE01_10727 [Pseudogymnoascus verrucosus]PQM43831.1 hypothetical protein VE01_10727 [Pseudogymnoascus verrucosus]